MFSLNLKLLLTLFSTKIANNLEIKEFQKLKNLTQNVEEVVIKFHEDIGIIPNFNKVMKTPEKTGIEQKPEEVLRTENTSKSVTDINTSEKTTIPTKKSILIKSDEMFVTKPIYEKIKPKPSEETNINNNTNKQFMCDFIGCGYQTYNENTLKEHHNIHTGLTPYKCNLCEKSFNSKRSVSRHLARVHMKSGSIKCPVEGCDRRFKDQIGSAFNHLIIFLFQIL